MNLTIERGPALAALSRVVGVVERRHIIPILANVVLTTTDGRLFMRATDLEMEAIESVEAMVSDAGETTIPADKLHDIVRSADPGAQIKVFNEATDPRLKVRSGRSNFSVPCMSAESFPKFTSDGLGEAFSMPAKVFAGMLARAKWAANTSKGSTIDGCVYLATVGDQIHAVAATQSAISLVREPIPAGARLATLLPMKLVDQFIRWLGEADGDVSISAADWGTADRDADWITQRLIRVSHASGQITGKLYDHPRYLDYARVVQETHELALRTDQDALKAAIRRALIMADAKSHAVRLTAAGGALTIQARNDQAGEGADEIAAEYEGPDVSFLLTAAHLEAALSHLRGDVVELCFAPAPVKKSNGSVDARSITTIIRAPSDPSIIVNLAQPRA